MAPHSAQLWGGHTSELEQIKIRWPRLMAVVQAYVHGQRDQQIWHDAFEFEWPHSSKDFPWQLASQGE